jgi:hypothetical protein
LGDVQEGVYGLKGWDEENVNNGTEIKTPTLPKIGEERGTREVCKREAKTYPREDPRIETRQNTTGPPEVR